MSNRVCTRPRAAGFTLVELMVTIAVGAILMAIALPALRTLLLDDGQTTRANNMWMALNMARSEARKQDTSVMVCPSVDKLTCTGSAADWPKGWIVLSTAPGTTGPLMSVPTAATNVTVSEQTPLAAVTFYSNGMANSAAAFTMCDARGASKARSVEVTLAGRVTASPNIGKRANGTVLVCP